MTKTVTKERRKETKREQTARKKKITNREKRQKIRKIKKALKVDGEKQKTKNRKKEKKRKALEMNKEKEQEGKNRTPPDLTEQVKALSLYQRRKEKNQTKEEGRSLRLKLKIEIRKHESLKDELNPLIPVPVQEIIDTGEWTEVRRKKKKGRIDIHQKKKEVLSELSQWEEKEVWLETSQTEIVEACGLRKERPSSLKVIIDLCAIGAEIAGSEGPQTRGTVVTCKDICSTERTNLTSFSVQEGGTYVTNTQKVLQTEPGAGCSNKAVSTKTTKKTVHFADQ